MKKLICAMLLCTLMTAVSCGRSAETESSVPDAAVSEISGTSSAEETTKESTAPAGTTAAATSAAATKPAVTSSSAAGKKPDNTETSASDSDNQPSPVGKWLSQEVGGVFLFGSDGVLKLQIDVSSEMTIDREGVVHMAGEDRDLSQFCSYDGETFRFKIDDDMDMMTLKRRDGADTSSAYGSYDLVSGLLYDNFVKQFGVSEGRYGMVVSDGSLICDITYCSYTAENGVITLIGDESSLFGEPGSDTEMNYVIHGDTMTLQNSGETMTLVRQ